jgi:hypothetical protein
MKVGTEVIVCLFVISAIIFMGGLFMFYSYKDKPECKPVKVVYETKTFTKYDTITIVDTLVIIERMKLVPYPVNRRNYISSWSIETQPFELFKDGKTRDTILKEVMENY